ncbi:hypothetical protein [Rhizobium paranaense]|uniref:ABC-type uncharacterized transport system fused permease/ATPase subunit n=1 Tax=Rhizobium paranaense TaxID=1650438 RepID=A0A7W9D4A6_9HYPH|nr:ABC-type uncharacterized transport system fused permease/ATPase subunit [Rhizobium paranaense]
MSDDQILVLLKRLGFVSVLNIDDLDKEDDWSTRLSPRDQQIVAIAGVLIAASSYVFFENADVIFGHDLLLDIFTLLAEHKIACVNLAEADSPREAYDAVLECHEDGSWNWIAQQGRS